MSTGTPIFLFTDFGSADIYVGQVRAVLHAHAPDSAVIDLLNDAPSFAIAASAHLLAALSARLPAGSVTIAVIDPGVGSARPAAALEADGRWFVGPDNGLLAVLATRASQTRYFGITAETGDASLSFHGRDVFAPVAARIAHDGDCADILSPKTRLEVLMSAADLAEIIYVDHYGNLMTGLRAAQLDRSACLTLCNRPIPYARVFSAVPQGELFWYENSIGLAEIAANQANASAVLGIAVGQAVAVR